MVLSFLNQYALAGFEGTFSLHAKEIIQFGLKEMGWVFTVCGFVMAAGQGTVVIWLMKHYGEHQLLRAGFAMMAASLMVLMTTRTLASCTY